MHRLFSYRTVHSEKNGKIEIKNWLFRKYVMVDGYEESGLYLEKMWRNAVFRVRTEACVQRVLLLGLGGGSALNPIHMQFPDAKITVIDWDPAMVEISRKLKLFDDHIRPEILVGDAVQVLKELDKRYDLILIDLFKGSKPESRRSTPEMIASIAGATTPTGSIILNAFKNKERIEIFAQRLEQVSSWRCRHNHLARFVTGHQP